MLTEHAMAQLLAEKLEAEGITQAEFCRRVGVGTKHMNLVLNCKATTRSGTLDYWAYVLGCRWQVDLVLIEDGEIAEDAGVLTFEHNWAAHNDGGESDG